MVYGFSMHLEIDLTTLPPFPLQFSLSTTWISSCKHFATWMFLSWWIHRAHHSRVACLSYTYYFIPCYNNYITINFINFPGGFFDLSLVVTPGKLPYASNPPPKGPGPWTPSYAKRRHIPPTRPNPPTEGTPSHPPHPPSLGSDGE